MFTKLLLSLIILSLCSINTTSPERLVWEEDRPLQWSDFKGAPDYLVPFAATTNSGMSQSYSIRGDGTLDRASSIVLAHFYPTFSWYKPADTSAFILKHEQTHFNITELYARKLRKRISEYSFTKNAAKEIKMLYHKTEKERKNAQEAYDKATNHSRNRSVEEYWSQAIKDSLELYWVYTP